MESQDRQPQETIPDWPPLSGVKVLQDNSDKLLVSLDHNIKRQLKEGETVFSLLFHNTTSSFLRNVQALVECSSVAELERIEAPLDFSPSSACIIRLYTKAKRAQIVEKKVNIGETIHLWGRLMLMEQAIPLPNTDLFVLLTDKQGCTIKFHVQKCTTNAEGYFKAEIHKEALGWHLRSLDLTFFTAIRIDMTLEFDDESGKHC